MIRRTLIVAVIAAFASSASAAEEKKAGDVGQYVDIQPVGLPIVHQGQLVNYIFVSVRINLTSSANAAKLREKEPYFRDALVRAGHRTPFTDPKNLSEVNVPMLTATMAKEATRIAGPGQVLSVAVTQQAPRRRIRNDGR